MGAGHDYISFVIGFVETVLEKNLQTIEILVG
jgi:hypothetical protein